MVKNNNQEYVIDYSNNLIMKKDDYYYLFNFQEINTISKYDLFLINSLSREIGANKGMIKVLLLFTKEALESLEKTNIFNNFFTKGNYDNSNMHKNNCLLYADELFHTKLDKYATYQNIRERLDKFTKTLQDDEAITYNAESDNYTFNSNEYKEFTFTLLSSILCDEEKEILLSNKRYRHCHENSIYIANALDMEVEDITITSGKIKVNDLDYVYHSWIELESANLVIDYNHNIIMNKEDYYTLYEAITIEKVTPSDIRKTATLLTKYMGMSFNYIMLNYFGKEFTKELSKKEKMFTKN